MKQKILLTGASSYVGARIYQDLLKKYDVVGTYFSNKLFPEIVQADLNDQAEVIKLIAEHKPDVIVHVAALPTVNDMQKHEGISKDFNFNSIKYIVDAAKTANKKLIYISSFAAIDPTDAYGESKLFGEKLVSTIENYVILRPSLVIGLSPNVENDRSFNRILKNITEHTKAIYDNSWQFQVTYLKHLSEVITEILENEQLNKITIPIVAKGTSNKFKLAQDILNHFDIEVTAEDKHMNLAIPEVDYSIYKKLGLPEYNYDEVIKEIVTEIKNYLNK